jgi:DNA repair protein RadC
MLAVGTSQRAPRFVAEELEEEAVAFAGPAALLPTLADMALARPTRAADHATAMLAVLLFCVLQRTAWPVAADLIAGFGSLSAVLAARRSRLLAVPGVTEAAANLIEAARGTLRCAAEEQIRGRPLLSSMKDVERYLRATMRGGAVETVHGLFLDRKNHLIRDVALAVGTVDHAPLYPREVVRQAIELDASAVVLYHNHPSGDPEPSAADMDTTRQVARALSAVNLALHDHLIVGGEGIVSLRQRRCF